MATEQKVKIMTVTIETIYRVVFVDQYQYSEPETHWTTDKALACKLK